MKKSKPNAAILFNSTGRDVYVLVGGKPRLLPTAPEPHVLGRRTDEGEIEIEVLGKNGKRGTASLRLEGDEEVTAIINDLPRVDGILYLVEPAILVAFPERDDFVAPSTYLFASDEFSRKERKGKPDLTDRAMARILPLASVTRRPAAVATKETPVLALD